MEQKEKLEQHLEPNENMTKKQERPSSELQTAQKFSQTRLPQLSNDQVPSYNLGRSIGSCELSTIPAMSATECRRPLTVLSGNHGRSYVKLSQPDHIKKVAIISDSDKLPLFYTIDQNRPLAAIVQDICDKWTLPNTEDYALQFSEPSRSAYVTDKNRGEIQNGNVLMLTDSSGRAAQQIIGKLENGTREEKIEMLRSLPAKLADTTFAMDFCSKSGDKLIIDYIIAGHKSFSGDPVGYLLRSFVALMDNNMISLQNLNTEFTKQVASCLSGTKAISDNWVVPALEILEAVTLQGARLDFLEQTSSRPDMEQTSSRPDFLEQYITPDKIIPYLQNSNPEVRQSALSLINTIFIMSSAEKKQKLADSFQSKTFRSVIGWCLPSILTSSMSSNIGSEMAHQIYKLQRLMLNMYEARMKQGVDLADSTKVAAVNKLIEDLRRIAFDFVEFADPNASGARKSSLSKDYRKLGFQNQVDPVTDFDEAPGLLALDNMLYFAQFHKESYVKVVLENCGRANEQDCPFVQASIQLTKILCQFLKIGEALYEDEHSYIPMFFTVEKPLEEFFCCCIQLMNRTWKEMRASKEDFSKVLSVVNEQIIRALDKNQMPRTFDMFKTKLGQLVYPELKRIWEVERQKKDESKSQSRPILELREMLKPEILELICKHRLTYLEGGSRFPKYENKNRVKSKYQYWRLSSNYKAFHFGDCGEKEEPSVEQLPNKINVIDIRKLITGKDCQHASKKIQPELIFSLELEGTGSGEDPCPMYYFVADSELEYMIWEDGINALLVGPDKMKSKKAMEDLETLLNMEIKLRLLETEGVTIPKEPPPVPPMPENFNFAYSVA